MGQAFPGEHLRCLADVVVPCSCARSSPEAELAGAHLLDFHNDRKLHPWRRGGALTASEEQAKLQYCCGSAVRIREAVFCDDAGLMAQELDAAGNNMLVSSDVHGLCDVDEDGLECGELFGALCMTGASGDLRAVYGDKHASKRHATSRAGLTLVDERNYVAGPKFPNDADGEAVAPSQEEAPQIAAHPTLKVPPDLLRFHDLGSSRAFEYLADRSTALRTADGISVSNEQERLRTIVKPFILAMLDGVQVKLHLGQELSAASIPPSNGFVDGRTRAPAIAMPGDYLDAVVSLSADFTILLITGNVRGHTRSVPMRSVHSVRPRMHGEDRECDVVLWLAENQFLCFKFDCQEQSSYFGACMRLLVKASRCGQRSRSGSAGSTRDSVVSTAATIVNCEEVASARSSARAS